MKPSSMFDITLLLFCAAVALPSVAAATFSVPAADPSGVNTGINVKQGDIVKFSATGTWCWSTPQVPALCADANGTPGRPNAEEMLDTVIPTSYFATLIGNVDGNYFPIGSSATIKMPATGTLILLMNDRRCCYGDNLGAISVTVTTSCQVNATPFFQTNPPPTYNKTCKTSKWGCGLDAVSSALTTFPSLSGTTPISLDAALQAHNGYQSCSVYFPSVGPSVNNAVGLVAAGSVIDYNSFLDQHFCTNNETVVLKMTEFVNFATQKKGDHFVVVTAKSGSDWTVFDPGWANASPQSALSSLAQHVTGFTTFSLADHSPIFHQFIVSEVRSFAGQTSSDASSLTATAHSPVELLLTDSQGRSLGYTGQDVFQIPLGSYFRDYPMADDDTGTSPSPGDSTGLKTAYILHPSSGVYSLDIEGIALGTYVVTIEATATDGTVDTSSISGISNAGSVTTARIPYSSSGAAGSIVLLATFQGMLDDITNGLQLGLIDNRGVANSLSQKIQAAQNASGPARKNILSAFKNEVNAQSGKHISGIAPQVLLQDADSLTSQNP